MILINFRFYIAYFILIFINIKYSKSVKYIVELLNFPNHTTYERSQDYIDRNYAVFQNVPFNSCCYVNLNDKELNKFYALIDDLYVLCNDEQKKFKNKKNTFYLIRPDNHHIIMSKEQAEGTIRTFENYSRGVLNKLKIHTDSYIRTESMPLNLNNKLTTMIYQSSLLPDDIESFRIYWRRNKDKLRDCANRNNELENQNIKILLLDNISNELVKNNDIKYNWFVNLKSTEVLGVEPKDFYNLRMNRLGKIPLPDILKKKFYEDVSDFKICDNEYVPTTISTLILQIVCNCTLPENIVGLMSEIQTNLNKYFNDGNNSKRAIDESSSSTATASIRQIRPRLDPTYISQSNQPHMEDVGDRNNNQPFDDHLADLVNTYTLEELLEMYNEL